MARSRDRADSADASVGYGYAVFELEQWVEVDPGDPGDLTAESLPVDDDWAQVVWSLATVHHWADVDRALAEARRVLAPITNSSLLDGETR